MWWNHVVVGQPLSTYITVAAILVAAFLCGAMVKLIYRRILVPMVRTGPSESKLLLLQRTERVAVWIVEAAIIYFAFQTALDLWGLHAPAKPLPAWARTVDHGFFALLVFLGSWAAYALVMALLAASLRGVSPRGGPAAGVTDFTPIIGRALKAVLLGISLIMVLDHFGVNVSGILATAGIASLAVALAAQDTIANMIGGFCLVADKTLRPGDRVELSDGKMGDVLDIGLRTTRLLTIDDTTLIVPNSELAKSRLVNYSYPTNRMAVRQKLGVAYGSDMEKVKRILAELAENDPEVLKEPKPAVYLMEFGDSSLDLLFFYWIANYRDQLVITDRMNVAIHRRFAAEQIEIPFPQRDVHIRTATAGPIRETDA
jgi:small-conductance mechanosensitive channel